MIKKFKSSSKGITLIALVITIIVLIILAGVAISMLSGDNGILNQAARAKEQTEQANIDEQLKLAVIASMTNDKHEIENLQEALDSQFGTGKATATQVKGGWSVSIEGKEYMVYNNGETAEITNIEGAKTSSSSNRIVKDANNETFVLPANFNLATNEDGSVIEDEITKGIVIEDSEDNQYVWIPVFEKSDSRTWGADYSAVAVTTEGTEEYYDAIEAALINTTNGYTKDYRNSSYTDTWYGNANYGLYGYNDEDGKLVYYTNGNMTEDEYNTLYHNMLKSVYKNDGFYIARYEMGIEVVDSTAKAQEVARTEESKEYVASSINSSNKAPTIEGMNKPVSKANAVAYNYITQSQAQMLAESLNYSGVTSSLMFGVQWDAVCVFIEHYDTRNEQGSAWLTNNTYSNEWGNYYNSTFTMDRGFYSTTYSSNPVTWNEKSTVAKGTSEKWLCTTGASDQNSSLNIYDFAGNLYEWTLERCSNSKYPCVDRGGNFISHYYASLRGGTYTYDGFYVISARPSLFM